MAQKSKYNIQLLIDGEWLKARSNKHWTKNVNDNQLEPKNDFIFVAKTKWTEIETSFIYKLIKELQL